jgi:hypothetical protein
MAATADGLRVVDCLVKMGPIASQRCAEMQADRKCFCPAAFAALKGAAVTAEKPRAADSPEDRAAKIESADNLQKLAARAAVFAKKPSELQFDGPALTVENERRARAARDRPSWQARAEQIVSRPKQEVKKSTKGISMTFDEDKAAEEAAERARRPSMDKAIIEAAVGAVFDLPPAILPPPPVVEPTTTQPPHSTTTTIAIAAVALICVRCKTSEPSMHVKARPQPHPGPWCLKCYCWRGDRKCFICDNPIAFNNASGRCTSCTLAGQKKRPSPAAIAPPITTTSSPTTSTPAAPEETTTAMPPAKPLVNRIAEVSLDELLTLCAHVNFDYGVAAVKFGCTRDELLAHKASLEQAAVLAKGNAYVPPAAVAKTIGQRFPGMPEFESVPIGWATEFLGYLSQSRDALDRATK